MTILCLSPSDDFIWWEAGLLAKYHNENILDYKLENLHHLSKYPDERLTILGHGNREVFGDARLTPQMLVADLIAGGLSTNIKTIDLAGCGIGEVDEKEEKDEKRKSYVRKFTEELHKDPRYRHIQVNGFTNTISDKPIALITLFSGLPGGDVSLCGLTESAKLEFDKRYSELLSKDETELKALLEKKVANRALIRDLKLNEKKDTTSQLAELQDLDAQLTQDYDLEEKKFKAKRLKVIETLSKNLGHKFCSGTDMRRTLDQNPNFHHSTEIFDYLDKLPKPRLISLQLINTRISELKEDLFEEKTSYQAIRFVSRLFSFSTAEHQISVLTSLANIIKNPDKPIYEVYIALAEAVHDPQLNTTKNLQVAEKVMKALNITPTNLEKIWLEHKNKPLTL